MSHLVCIGGPCTEHRHRRHPGQSHCESCLEDSNDGYGSVDWTFDSRKATDDRRCCCRDERIGLRYRRQGETR